VRWKLLKRRLSISAPRVIVRSHLPWPLRWAVFALMLGFSAALALWAFEFGKSLAGVGQAHRQELLELRAELAALRGEREQARSIANTADSLLRSERVAQERLAAQIKVLEAENLALREDLGFFEQLMPAGESGALIVRGLHAELVMPGQLRFQMLVMRNGRNLPDFRGRYELTLRGRLDGRPWTHAMPGGARALELKHYQRTEGVIDFPAAAVVEAVEVKVTNLQGAVQARQTTDL
jgi:hypothetical protein